MVSGEPEFRSIDMRDAVDSRDGQKAVGELEEKRKPTNVLVNKSI